MQRMEREIDGNFKYKPILNRITKKKVSGISMDFGQKCFKQKQGILIERLN